MKSYFHKKIKGFTLIELIVAMGISLIILTVITSILGLSGSVLKGNIGRNKLENNGRYAIDYIEKEVRRSINIYPIDDYDINARENNLGFLLQVDPYNEENKYQYIYYSLDRKTLMRHSIGSSEPIEKGLKDINVGNNSIASNINSISKSYYNASEKFIHLNFECSIENINKNYESSIYAGVGL